MIYKNIYHHFNTISPILEDEWSSLESKLTYKIFKKGEIFQSQHQGEIDLIAIILEGHFSISHFSEEGDEKIKYFASPLDLIGDYPAILQGRVSKTIVRSLTKSKALIISYFEFKRLCNAHPCWFTLENKILEKLYLLKEKREHSFLEDSALERYVQFRQEFPDLNDIIPQKQIATYIGITPTSLSRLLKS